MNDYKIALFEMLVEAEMKKSPATQAVAKFIGPQQMLSDLGAEMKKLAAKDEEMEEGLATAAGIAISLPKMVEWIGKALGWITNKIRKVLGKEKLERNVIVDFAHSWHHLYIVGIKKLLKLVFGKKLPDDKAEKLAERIFYIIVAGLFLSAGLTTVKAFMKGDSILAGVEGALTSVKGSELGAYLGEVLGGLNLVGTAGAAVDAAEVADAIDGAVTLDDLFKGDLTEMSAMSPGAVEVGAGKTKDNLEENKMNKLRITKGRLRQILAEEVARHQKQKLNEMRGFKVGDQVRVVDGGLRGATGKIIEPTTLITGEEGFVLVLDSDADKPVFGKAGDEVIVGATKLKPPVSATLNEMGAAEEEAEAASFASQAKGAAATKGGSEQADAFYEGEEPMEEEKTEKYDDEMKEKFSKKQAEKLPDELQKAMLKKEVRAMLEEMLKGEGEKTLEGKRPPSMRKRTMKDLDDEAKTRETDFLKKKKGEKKKKNFVK